jgi:hypothetical protein
MKNTSGVNQLRRYSVSLAIVAALAAVPSAMAQSGNAAKGIDPSGYSILDIGAFGGEQWFQFGQGGDIRPLNLNAAPTVGVRFVEDPWKYVGFEESFGVAFNKIALLPYGLTSRATLPQQDYTLSAVAMLNFTPRGSRFRPFILLGPGATWYFPERWPHINAPAGVIVPAVQNPRMNLEPGIVYGTGVKMQVTKKLALRVEVRGNWTLQPHFGLPSYPYAGTGSLYIPSHGTASGLALEGTILYSLRYHEPPPPPAPAPPPPPPPPPPPAVTVSAISGAHDVCPGDNLPLSVTVGGGASAPSIQWNINGRPAPGGTSSTFSLPTTEGGPGNRSVTVTATSGSDSKTSAPVDVRVKSSAAPTVQFSLSQSSIAYGDRVPLSATATGSDCTDPVTVRYTASEGTVTGNNYDSSGVAFDMNNRLHEQNKTITLTATATDAKGQTARATANLTVNLTPQAKRYDDIVFPNNSARVNNCGKRILLEQVTPDIRNDPGARVILIGHRDNGERVALRLDDKRVANAAAILSAGKGICPSLDLSRILVHSAGTDQASQTRPALCGSSVQERAGQTIRDNDERAQFRRVEVWVVPSGAAMPEGTAGYGNPPDRETKALGCPR